MTESSSTPTQAISSQIDGKPGGKYTVDDIASTAGSLNTIEPGPLQRVCLFRQGASACRIRVAYSEKQASQGRRREEINRRLMR